MNHPETSGLFNLGAGQARSFLDVMGSLFSALDRETAVQWMDTPVEIRDRYQYYTQAEMDRLRAAGYDQPFLSLEDGIAAYVKGYLATDDRYR